MERAIDELCLLPLAWPRLTVDARLRRRVLGTFLYSIIYEPETASILIIAVAHHHRRPGYWLSRAADPR